MKKWMKISGLVAAIAAVSVMSFAAVSYAQEDAQGFLPNVVEHIRGPRGGEIEGEKLTALATALGMAEEDVQAALDAGQTPEEIAEAQGLDWATVKESLTAQRLANLETDLAEKVAAGEITQEQADEILSRAEEGDFPGRGKRGGHHGHRPSFADASPEAQAALAGVLNMTVEDLQAAIDSGQRINEIAEAQGVEMDAVKAVMDEFRLAELETKLAEKVAAGEITQEQADEILQRAQDGDFPGRGGRGGERDGERGPRGQRGGPRGEAPEGSFPGNGANFQAPTDAGSNL